MMILLVSLAINYDICCNFMSIQKRVIITDHYCKSDSICNHERKKKKL